MIKIISQNTLTEIVLDREDSRNALTFSMIQELQAAFKSLSEDSLCRAIVLRSTGDHFCAGADLNWMKDSAKMTASQNEQEAKVLYDLLYSMLICPKPIIAVAKGSVYGGGVGLLAASDFVIADQSATFCMSEVALGLTPSMISPFVVQKMGYSHFKSYALSAKVFDTVEAHRLGLVSHMTTAVELENSKASLIGQLLKNAPNAMAEVKKLTQFLYEQHHWNIFSNELPKHIASVRSGKEAQEGLQCFFDRKRPSWSAS